MNPTMQAPQNHAKVAPMLYTMCLAQIPLVALWYVLKGRDDGSEISTVRAVCCVLVGWLIATNFVLCVAILL